MRRRREKQELRGAGEQDRPQVALTARQRLFEVARQHGFELAERGAARSRRSGGRARGRAAASASDGELLGERVVERALLAQDGGDEPDGGLARGKPGRRRRPRLPCAWRCASALALRGASPDRHARLAPRARGAARRDPRGRPRPTEARGRSISTRPAVCAALARHLLAARRCGSRCWGASRTSCRRRCPLKRIDDEHVRGRGNALGRLVGDLVRVALDLGQRRGEPQRMPADHGAARGRRNIRASG